MKADITYTKVGDYLIPDLVMDPQPEGDIGHWGWQRKEFLRKHKRGVYNAMLMQGTLTQHLIDINRDALDMMETIVKRTAELENVTEDLKRRDQMEWVRRMNNIRSRAEEFVRSDLIYT
ncbi:MAG: TnpV protein [Lachnospiraceae bacterium]|nr:TnpV protein [Lachnospiraceae bacterium]